ncbi:MAG: beta-ketoacyl-[acyl-carrier-protein] synthase family protein [Planctomycetota bacterium]|nr:MAG: beta-ketoacyl-[acyl-carrier-protein] synthase family protein [Planctomycetota bacterium]
MQDPRQRIVITGIGLTAPNGDSLAEFRGALLEGRSGVQPYEIRYVGPTLAGICRFEATRYQKRKELRKGTRAGSVSIYCCQEAVRAADLDLEQVDRRRIGVFLGITEHGNVETENEVYSLGQYNNEVKYWSHHHNPRTVANNPAGEVTINMGLPGPHYTIGAACAAGNAGLIQGVQMLRLGEVDVALAGGVSEAIHTFGIFASFKAQGALAEHEDPAKASRPFDMARNGIVVSEGGAVYVLETLEQARRRDAPILGEIVGYAMNSDATDAVLPNSERQAECMRLALERARLEPGDVDIVSTHATATRQGDIKECAAVRAVFGNAEGVYVNNTKSYIGHCMGAAGALELAGNLPSFEDKVVHPTINVDELDPECALPGLVIGEPREVPQVDVILNNSFGMLGINSAVVVRRFVA